MGREAIWKVLASIAKSAVTARRFRSYQDSRFTLRRGRSLDHNTAILRYEEGAEQFDIVAEEGVDGGFSMDINEMGAKSLGYSSLSLPEKIRIAGNIRDALASQKFPCQVILDNRVL